MLKPGEGLCPPHKAESNRATDASRGTTAERGYGAAWQRKRRRILARDPVCKRCDRKFSTEVDHIIPKVRGGSDADDNLQGLCKPCHSEKTAKEDGRWGPRS